MMGTRPKPENFQVGNETFVDENWNENDFIEIQDDEDSDEEEVFIPELERPWYTKNFSVDEIAKFLTENLVTDDFIKFIHKKCKMGNINLRDLQRTILLKNKLNISEPFNASENNDEDTLKGNAHFEPSNASENIKESTLKENAAHFEPSNASENKDKDTLKGNSANFEPSNASENKDKDTLKGNAANFELSNANENKDKDTLKGNTAHFEPEIVWETLYHKYDKAASEKDYYEAARLSRLMLSHVKLEVRSGRLSRSVGLKFQESILHLYSNLVDDVNDDGVHNYLEIVQLFSNASNSQCSDWKSGLSSATKEHILKYSSKGKNSVTKNIYPLFDSEDENEESETSDTTVINETYERIDIVLSNCSFEMLEETFGEDAEYIFGDPDASEGEDFLPETEKKTATVIPDFFNPKQKAHLSTSTKSNKIGSTNRNVSRENDNVTYETETKNTFKRKKLAKESESQEPCTSIQSQKPAFATAKDVFHEQQNKKGFNNSRKCLGTRRGPGSKFVTPFHNPDEDDEKPKKKSENTEELQDERLKGIDPKMVEVMLNEIMDHDSPVSWDDIAGLEFVKTTLKEIVVWPMLRPDIFKGLRAPPKGILLFGPPGTGKTLIGKCVASQSKSTFFSISASSLGSKWYGEGEKLVRALFTVARCYQPAVIFIDEIDSLLTQRSDNDHESSRRVKTEFLVQLDGVKTTGDERLLIIGATNRPQELDEAARRRLVKRLYIPLPEPEARIQIVKTLLANHNHELSNADFETLKARTDGYSGADMANLCKEAALGPIRCINLDHIASITNDQVRPIRLVDFIKALTQVRASVGETDLTLYEQWNKKYGSNFSETNIS